MAINVNTVYQTVLFILNKEQRGYMTPPEFNKIAAQVQLEIFEGYFEDLNQFLRMPRNSSEYAERVKTLEEKMFTFETRNVLGQNPVPILYELPDDVHRLGTLQYEPTGKSPVECEEVTHHEFNLISRSKLTTPSLSWPMFTIRGNIVQISPNIPDSDLFCYYIKKPANPIWAFTIGGKGEYVWEDPSAPSGGTVYPTVPGTSVHFEISDIDQNEVVTNILLYAGIVIRDPQIIQVAGQMQAKEETNEKR